MKKFKGSEVVIYAMALMLVAAGYFNYMTFENQTQETYSEDVTEIKFAVVLFIMSILNMILCFISFWSVNINEISIFLDNGATNREIMLFVAIKWILAYGIAYLIATVSAMWALYSVNDMLPYNDVELYLTIVFIVSVLCCFIIGYFGFIRMKRKGIALHGKDN